jgi:2-methylcitrate dehydratase
MMSCSRLVCSRFVKVCALNWQQGKPFEFQRPYGSYIMENVFFKISYPAEFHAQTAVEAAHTTYAKLKGMGKTSDDIKSVVIRTQEAAIRIIDKQGPLDNFADRE